MFGYFFFRLTVALLRLMPFGVMYRLSDVLHLLLYYVLRYRVSLVRYNFAQCFPGKDEKWVRRMTKAYYRYLTDILLESMKALHTPTDKLLHRFQWKNMEIFQQEPYASSRIVIMGSHYGNWEYMTRCLPHVMPHEVAGIYRPISNRRIEKYLARHRSKDGLWLVSVNESKEAWQAERSRDVAYVLLADQNPSNPSRSYWFDFLHRETGFTPGAEVYARRFNYPVITMLLRRPKRGFYEVYFEELEANPADSEMGSIMGRYVRKLENWIREDPVYWLWSHRRWKHRRPEEMEIFKNR